MRALVKRKWTVAIHLPAHVIPMHAPLAGFDVGSTCANIELHTNRFVLVLAKLNVAPIRNLYAPFALLFAASFAFAFLLWRAWTVLWIRLKPLVG